MSALLKITELSLKLGEVDRRTEHPNGKRESDTTHTTMLGLVCIFLVNELGLELDRGLVAEFALVHDLHEAICGDECTLHQDPDALNLKAKREESAIQEINSLPTLGILASNYQSQVSREARFVRAVDKLLPKLTHLLNSGKVLIDEQMDKSKFHEAIMVRQYQDMERYCFDLPEVLALHRKYGQLVEDQLPEPSSC